MNLKFHRTVTVSADQVDDFARTWPCCNFPHEWVRFTYEPNGDLVDIDTERTPSELWNDEALLALSQDAARGYGKLSDVEVEA